MPAHKRTTGADEAEDSAADISEPPPWIPLRPESDVRSEGKDLAAVRIPAVVII
jgi:hypothetical protein